MRDVRNLFADIRSALEDMHGIAVEGQRRDNAPDIQRVLVSLLRMTIVAVNGKMGEIKQRLGDAHD